VIEEPPLENAGNAWSAIKGVGAQRAGLWEALNHLLADPSDAGNANWFVACNKDDLLYSHAREKWLVFDGIIWRQDDSGQVKSRVESAVRALLPAAADRPDAGKIAAWVTKSLSKRALAAIEELARYKLVAPKPEQFDADPMLLAVSNGVVDLMSGECWPGTPTDYLSRTSAVEHKPSAICPTWIAFLERIFDGDCDLIAYVQRAVGYTLTGKTTEQVFFTLHGTGANGKSRLQEILVALLGGYAQTAGVETFLEHQGNRGSTSDLARLEGARLVVAAESDENRRIAAGLLKQVTGGDQVTAALKYQNERTFAPTFKLWFATNHLPRITDTSIGMWRRIHQIPFKVVIPEADRDLCLGEKLARELPGILNWSIEGARSWQQRGLDPPQAVLAATKAYRTAEDQLADFLEEIIDVGDAYTETTAALFKAYETYASEAKIPKPEILSGKRFGERLNEQGFAERRTRMARFRDGLRIKPQTPA